MLEFDADAQGCAAASPARRVPTSASWRSTSARPRRRARYLDELARTATGPFRLDDAPALAAFEDAVAARDDGDQNIPGPVAPARALEFMPAFEVAAAQAAAVRNGARLPGGPPHPVRLVFRGELLAVYGPARRRAAA